MTIIICGVIKNNQIRVMPCCIRTADDWPNNYNDGSRSARIEVDGRACLISPVSLLSRMTSSEAVSACSFWQLTQITYRSGISVKYWVLG